MTVEKLTVANLGAVAELEKICFADPWSEKALELLVGDGAYGAVCIQNGCVMAYGGVLWAPDEGQITNIATHPNARRQGMGAAVLEHLIKEAKKLGCEQLSLEARVSNTLPSRFMSVMALSKWAFAVGFTNIPPKMPMLCACNLKAQKNNLRTNFLCISWELKAPVTRPQHLW